MEPRRTHIQTPSWKDKVTAYNGTPITYDAIGNPLSYGAWSYTWKAGRMLHSMVRAGTSAQFTYDHTGLRVKKSVNGEDTLYTLNGKNITHIRKGNTQMHFFYDAQGRPSIMRYNGVDYTYMHNLQGDIVAIVDQEGKSVVEYSYDAWGRQTSFSTTGGFARLGMDNPFRYRGYVYDEETGLYYLRSRYYDPEWGRFISADSLLGAVAEKLTHNIYTYCLNSTTSWVDSEGKDATTAYIEWTQNMTIIANSDGPSPVMDGVAIVVWAILGTASLIQSAFDSRGYDIQDKPMPGPPPPPLGVLAATPAPESGKSLLKEHTKNARPSTLEGHEKGLTRRQQDEQKKEKGDARRKPNPNKRRAPTSVIVGPHGLMMMSE